MAGEAAHFVAWAHVATGRSGGGNCLRGQGTRGGGADGARAAGWHWLQLGWQGTKGAGGRERTGHELQAGPAGDVGRPGVQPESVGGAGDRAEARGGVDDRLRHPEWR